MTRWGIVRGLGAAAAVLGALAFLLNPQAPVHGAAGPAVSATPQWGADIRVGRAPTDTAPYEQNFALAISPIDPNVVVAGYDNWNNAPTNSAYARSTDGGRTWTSDWFYAPWFGDGEPNGETSVAVDRAGTLYYTSSYIGNGGAGFAVLTSTVTGPWNPPVRMAEVGPGSYYDEGHLVVDLNPASPFAGSLYFVMRYYGINGAEGVWLTYSRDHGAHWSVPLAVSDQGHKDAFGPVVGVAADSSLYVAFAFISSSYLDNDPIYYISRSTDGGVSWSGDRKIDAGLAVHIGALDAEGHELMLLGNGNQQGVRVNNMPFLGLAPSDPQTVYAVWNDGRWDQSFTFFGHPGRNSDIAFTRSTDAGLTWSPAQRVNDDTQANGVDQFLPSLAVHSDGTIGITWYDRRLDPNHFLYDLFYSQSTDRGLTWSANTRVTDRASDPLAITNGELNGDLGLYSALAFGPDYALASWVDSRGGYAKEFYVDRGLLPGLPGTATPGATATRPATATAPAIASATPTQSPPASPTTPPAATATAAPPAATPTTPATTPTRLAATATATTCTVQFGDVAVSDYFYPAVLALACRGVISGYADGTFRPYNQTTRAQMVKIVVLGFGFPLTTPGAGDQTFADVPPGSPFFAVIETAAARGLVNGYSCGGAGEPCDSRTRPYFRQGADVTRGQLAKVVVNARGWAPANPPTPTFQDVPAGSPFYGFVEQAVAHGVLSGYACGAPGEPCPGRYFRPGGPSTRGQLSKILYNALSLP